MELLGGTGGGKTELGTIPAAKNARNILRKGIGDTNSTIKEHLMVFTTDTEYTNKIVVAVRLDESPMSQNRFSEIFISAMVEVVKKLGKAPFSDLDKAKKCFKEALQAEVSRKNNIKAVLSFLSDEQISYYIEKIADLYEKYKLQEHNFKIYNAAKNDMSEAPVKENSKKFLSAIRARVGHTLDLLPNSFRKDFWSLLDDINRQLYDIFFTYFDAKNLSEDKYYYKELDLNAPDENFIAAMFTSNNIQAGEKLSLEVFCAEIVIYIPMDEKIASLVRNDPMANKIFCDSQDHIVFGILDTRGLYHADNTEDENVDYCNELVYKAGIDAVIVTLPLWGDPNTKKAEELYQEVFKDYYKQTPIFVVHNKLDLYIDSLSKDILDDPLSTEDISSNDLSSDDIRLRIEKRIKELDGSLQSIQIKGRRSLNIEAIACYLKRNKLFPSDLVEEFNVLNVYRRILQTTAENLEEATYKIRINIEDGGYPVPVLNLDVLHKLLHAHILDSEICKKVFTPGMENLSKNLGITPHGNSYNALRRRLRNGEGYKAEIDASYYYNCQSFTIKFTANLRNFVTPAFLSDLVDHALNIRDGTFEDEESRKRFLKIVKQYVNPREFVRILLYDNALLRAERSALSFGGKFQNFLQNSISFLDLSTIDEVSYEEALKSIILNAAEWALNLYTTFR